MSGQILDIEVSKMLTKQMEVVNALSTQNPEMLEKMKSILNETVSQLITLHNDQIQKQIQDLWAKRITFCSTVSIQTDESTEDPKPSSSSSLEVIDEEEEAAPVAGSQLNRFQTMHQ